MSVNKVNSDGSLLRVAGGTVFADAPVGTITPFGGSDIPSGYLLCNGQAVSRTNYAELFAVIGTAFGAGDGSTTFNLPDMTGKTTMGVETGHVLGTSEDGALPNIVGRIDYNAAFSNYLEFNGSFTGINVEKDYYKTTGSADGVSRSSIIDFNASSSSNLYTDGQTKVDPANVRVNYIIKAKQSAIPTDFSESLVGYVGKETNYNLYPWSSTRASKSNPATYLDFVVERNGWYSVDYTLEQSDDSVTNSFAIRDFDEQGETHVVGQAEIKGCTHHRGNIIVPLKAGAYRYHHNGKGTLDVYMNRRDFA